MKKKLKPKKQTWAILIAIVFIILAIFTVKSIYSNYKYKQTNEYKLLQKGYTKDDITLINDKLKEEEISSLVNSNKNENLLKIIKEKYFIPKNLNRYLKYYDENNNLTPTKVVSIINTNTDYKYYEHDIDADISKNELLLVNKYYHLKSDYEPDDLVNVSNKYYYGENHKIRKIAYEAFVDMWNVANSENIYLIINSSYRGFDEQKDVYEEYKASRGTTYADSIAARPGYSEHQTGLSLDIFSKDNTITSTFANSDAYKWLCENAHKYGFIQRYTKDYEDLTGYKEETWHWRYVGVDAATYIHDNNITYDEYYAYFLEK